MSIDLRSDVYMRKLKVYLDTSVISYLKQEDAPERTKDMTMEEKIAYYNTAGMEAEKEIERRRALKRKVAVNA